jgi:hypothetical protein
MSRLTRRVGALALSPLPALLVGACASGSAPAPGAPAPARGDDAWALVSTSSTARDDALGGRLFDRWFDGRSFRPDGKATPELDGVGGPFGNGSLARADGAAWPNDGHDYRLKNLLGWDLRGRAGIYGPGRMNKSYAVAIDALSDPASEAEWFVRLRDGTPELPALGPVLDPARIAAIARFLTGVRDHRLAHPEEIFQLDARGPGFYALREGADPARGKALFAERCADCHGADGTDELFDGGAYSLGSHARQKAYEDWAKMLSGQPGTEMDRQVEGATGAEMSREILDILAALCDRAAFPLGKASGADVEDGDPRCGAYLR